MRVDAAHGAVQFALLSRHSGLVQKLNEKAVQSHSRTQTIDGDRFIVQSRQDLRAAQQAAKAAHFQQIDAQHPPQASINGLANGRRFQPEFSKSPAGAEVPSSETPATTQEAPQPDGVFGQDQIDAINSLFGSQVGDRAYESSVDFNSDGAIDFNDITYVLSMWGQPLPFESQTMPEPSLDAPFGQDHLDAVNEHFGKSLGDAGFLAQADTNSDGTIDFSDITHILSNWGKSLSPDPI